MGKLLLVGSGSTSWGEWLKEHRGNRDLVVLDPADTHHGPPGRLWVVRGSRPVYSSFYGSLDPVRSPHLMVAALHEFLGVVGDDAIIQMFPVRTTPLVRQLAQVIADMVRPEKILVADGLEDTFSWPIGPEQVSIEKSLPPMVHQAQRKAQWLKLVERGARHEIALDRVILQGARLGSGRQLDSIMMQRVGLEHALRVEVCGTALLVVSDEHLPEEQVSRALDLTHTQRAHLVHPSDYRDLLCAFVRLSGEEFGYGRIEEIDFAGGRILAHADAVPPVPVPIVRLGSLRVDADGRELGELRPWQV